MTDSTEITEPVDFIDSEEKPGVAYIKPHLEVNLTPEKKQECRNILAEIKNFGVSQRQMLFLIDLLSLELDALDLVREIRTAVKNQREKMNQDSQSPGLIIPDSQTMKKLF